MKEHLWLFSHRNQWWTDGVHRITVEVMDVYNWKRIRQIIACDWGIDSHNEMFDMPTHAAIRRRLDPDKPPLTPEEVIAILDREDCECTGLSHTNKCRYWVLPI